MNLSGWMFVKNNQDKPEASVSLGPRAESMQSWPSGHCKITLDDQWLSAVRAAAEHLDRVMCGAQPLDGRSENYWDRMKGKLGEAAVAVWFGAPRSVLFGDPLDEADVGPIEVKFCSRADPRLRIAMKDRDRKILGRPYVLTTPVKPMEYGSEQSSNDELLVQYRDIWIVGWRHGSDCERFEPESNRPEWRIQPKHLKNVSELRRNLQGIQP
ncbi:MAG: hypothetical protein OEV43_00510 [Coriobacteriia bacterium]|nr:hypothetical protein [Coriobacteriia bacterium]